jgi:NADH:ubiquinone oxidoreductase subunit F (NADH-binding)
MKEPLLTKNVSKNCQDIDAAMAKGAYQGLEKALSHEADWMIEELITSQLRGRGGAGFPTGRKWEMARAQPDDPKYLICNADEGEPGTFKDRLLVRHDPHQLIEAMAIGGHTIGAHHGFIYIRGEYFDEVATLENAIRQARKKGILGESILDSGFAFDIEMYVGAGAYICGDETALFQSMEGYRANPREKPPYPVQEGFRHKPTVINNVETMCNIPLIARHGGEWYSEIGPEGSKGPKLFCLSGHVNNPGVYEAPLGTTLRELVMEKGGGVKGGNFKALLPGGIASSLLNSLDITMDFGPPHGSKPNGRIPSVVEAGSMLGSGAVIVINDRTNMVEVARNCIEYFIDESCGQCTPCREGTLRTRDILERLLHGETHQGDIELLLEIGEVLYDTSRCGLGQSAMNVVTSAIKLFRGEFNIPAHKEAHHK